MAFSAQPDHGQNERKQRVFTNIVKLSSKERSKFVPNPAAKPFVPSSILDKATRSNKTWSSAYKRQNSQIKNESCKNDCSKATTSYQNGQSVIPNGSTLLHSHSISNGVNMDNSHFPTQSQPGKHIALHLLSKVLDDETIFNFTNIDESSGSVSEEFDGTAHSWPLSSANNHTQCAPTVHIPNFAPNFGSFPGQNIWSNESSGLTPPLSPLDSSSEPSSCNEFSSNELASFPKPMRPNSLPDCDRFSPLVNGFLDDQSPFPSPTGQSYSSSNASPLQTFLPIQEPCCNGKSQQSYESGYASNSNNNSYYGSQMSPSSVHGYVPSSPEVHSFALPLSAPGSVYNSSPSLSPSSPPLGQIKFDRKQFNTDSEHLGSTKSQQHFLKEKSYPSPSFKDQRENGYAIHGSLPRTKSPFSSELHVRLDDCYEQLRCLEKDRKKAEAEISHLWSSRKFSSPGNCVNFRLPPNPSRVDKMVIDQLREHAKVESLVGRIERIRHSPLHQSINESVEQWQQAIKELQAKRREEMGSCSNGIAGRSRLGPAGNRFHDSSDVQALVVAVKDVSVHTRAIRTTVWCAVHLVTCVNIPKGDSLCESKTPTMTATFNLEQGSGEVS